MFTRYGNTIVTRTLRLSSSFYGSQQRGVNSYCLMLGLMSARQGKGSGPSTAPEKMFDSLVLGPSKPGCGGGNGGSGWQRERTSIFRSAVPDAGYSGLMLAFFGIRQPEWAVRRYPARGAPGSGCGAGGEAVGGGGAAGNSRAIRAKDRQPGTPAPTDGTGVPGGPSPPPSGGPPGAGSRGRRCWKRFWRSDRG
jgi:hypothetical protein